MMLPSQNGKELSGIAINHAGMTFRPSLLGFPLLAAVLSSCGPSQPPRTTTEADTNGLPVVALTLTAGQGARVWQTNSAPLSCGIVLSCRESRGRVELRAYCLITNSSGERIELWQPRSQLYHLAVSVFEPGKERVGPRPGFETLGESVTHREKFLAKGPKSQTPVSVGGDLGVGCVSDLDLLEAFNLEASGPFVIRVQPNLYMLEESGFLVKTNIGEVEFLLYLQHSPKR